MGREIKGHLSHCGRVISAEELADIRETVATCSCLSRSELALTIAEHLEWYTTGTGLTLQGKSYTSSPKKIFVLPLVPDFRTILCSNGGTRP
jgi:hypothetical protein